MSTAVPASSRRGRPGAAIGAVLVVAVGLATAVAGVVSGGHPALTLAPVLLAAAAVLAVQVPLRWPATLLVFLLLSLDVTGDAEGFWSSPLAHLGDLFTDISGRLTGVHVAGFELAVLLLLGLAARRRSKRSTIDGEWTPMPGVIRDCILLFLLGLAYAALLGVATGKGLPFWKARNLLHIPLFYLFFRTAYGRAADMRAVGVAVVAAAQIKALLAAWVQKVAAVHLTGGPLAYATNHGDSVLFAAAILILLGAAAERAGRRSLLRAMLFIPLPLWGMVLNRRRIAWAMLEFGLLMIFLVSAWRPWKRKLVTALVLGAPVILLYVGIGWNGSGSGIFGPVHKVRSMLDARVDSSTYWREVESWNVAMSLRSSPILGVGLGGEYTEYMKNADISWGYPEYRQWPHNTVLGLFLLTGVFGFVCLWMPNLLTIFLAVRVYRQAAMRYDRAAALACVSAIVCCVFLAWGDTGAHFLQHKMATGLALALAGRLAAETGAWPMRRISPLPELDLGPGPERSLPLSAGRGSAGTSA
ncbi:MAG TPA: O-antigen ligase family protein [Anaeromyxobacter sp.]|nr:O-antigen ligase family protein [Anaeromyxobacter sp.]